MSLGKSSQATDQLPAPADQLQVPGKETNYLE